MIPIKPPYLQLGFTLFLTGGLFFDYFAKTDLVQAQITSDGTVSTQVTSSDHLNFMITGGTQAGKNLFHSFDKFSIPTGGSAIFDNAISVQNIINRVTGKSISHIDGLIQTQGSANLFLLNPNGIIFGPNAQLNVGGSFIASTASQINFADGNIFSATDLQAPPLLSVSIPIGLQFREKAANIINQSNVNDGFGLQVSSGNTLALVGGDIFLEGGNLTVLGGRIELGSISAPAVVGLIPISTGWALDYNNVQNFQNIQLSQNSTVKTFLYQGNGEILLRGKQITLTGNSELLNFNFGEDPGGNISLIASDLVAVTEDSNIRTRAFAAGASANIMINTRRLLVSNNGAFIDTATESDGRGGNLSVNATESVEVDGGYYYNGLLTKTFAGGDAGDLKIQTQRLILRNGGLLSSSTNGSGNGGTISIDASKSVEISGLGVFVTQVIASGIFAYTANVEATGNGGIIRINTQRLTIFDGGVISVVADKGSTGQAGTININASNLVLVSGSDSGLLAKSESPKAGGNLLINTEQLTIQNGAQVSVSATGEGAAGNLLLNASSIDLNHGILTAETRSGEGNINLQSQNIILRNQSEITTNATGKATGGNITINTDVLTALENSDITANAEDARGGRVTINTQGIFRSADSDITARSALGPDFSGTVTLNLPDTDPNRGIVQLSETPVDPNVLIAQNPCQKRTESQFTITGRGSLPPSVNQDLSTSAVQVGLVEPTSTLSTQEQPPNYSHSATNQKSVVPAQGWVFNDQGQVILTAYNPNITQPERLPPKSESCPNK
ncbi:filamentous hemagglutinin N-terminal domain-containing protein [Gloeothece verrucosa]|uniref:Filamentous hemagglutinin family outer membrane protein n=1 Tax=Gloeothece verrucosa (strain PCC 7822) TaxID=497965 RepID=E0UFJ8_GLOV7|nr:filamentous hemagglutinin N-terminal domain-containing protein [Gloeothece verrucosa]ADN16692.1 filamentous hemagglutinin family outer membrane protein [Gloeothece verrucosa PCC 7822]